MISIPLDTLKHQNVLPGNILQGMDWGCLDDVIHKQDDMPDNNSPELSRLVLLLSPQQRDFIDSKVDRITSRSSYLRGLIDAAMAKEAAK